MAVELKPEDRDRLAAAQMLEHGLRELIMCLTQRRLRDSAILHVGTVHHAWRYLYYGEEEYIRATARLRSV